RGFIEPPAADSDLILPRLQLRGRIVDEAVVPQMPIENLLYAVPEMGGNYQLYHDDQRLVIDAELASGANAEAARAKLLVLLAKLPFLASFQVEMNWVEHIPRAAGKTRRIRPLADRTEVMAQAPLLRRSGVL